MNDSVSGVMPDFCGRRHPFHFATALNTLTLLGIDIDRIDLLAVGEYENFKGEIREQEPPAGTVLTGQTPIVLKVGFSSPVDFMPYQFFFGLLGNRARSPEWEDQARALFAPFDASVIRYSARARYQILKYAFSLIDKRFVTSFLELFNFEAGGFEMDLEEALIWVRLLPYFHFWAGNRQLVPLMLQLIFGYEFEIRENAPFRYSIPSDIQYRLGSKVGRLGREVIVGRDYEELDTAYELIIKGIPPDKVGDFYEGKPLRKKLDWILNICMPNNLEWRLRYKVSPRKMMLGQDNRQGYLGHATYI